LQFCPTILPWVSENWCSKGTLDLGYKRTEADKTTPSKQNFKIATSVSTFGLGCLGTEAVKGL